MACWLAQCTRALTPERAPARRAQAVMPRLLGKAHFRTQACQDPSHGHFAPTAKPRFPRPPWFRSGPRAASFLAVQWFLPMASAQSDDSGQFHRQGRAPSFRQIRYHRDESQLQPGTGRRIPAFPGCAPAPSLPLGQHRSDSGNTRLACSQQPVTAFNQSRR